MAKEKKDAAVDTQEEKEVKVEERAQETKEEVKAEEPKKEEAKKALKAPNAKIKKILDEVAAWTKEERTELISSLIKNVTVLELSEWVKSLEDEFGVSAAAPVAAMAVMPGAADAGGDGGAAQAEEKTEFTVTLKMVGDKKIQVIKEVRAVTSLGLKEAKDLVDNAPKPVKENVTKEEAEDIKAKLEAVGATVEIS